MLDEGRMKGCPEPCLSHQPSLKYVMNTNGMIVRCTYNERMWNVSKILNERGTSVTKKQKQLNVD